MDRKKVHNVERPNVRRVSRNTRRAAVVVLALSSLGVIGPMTSANAGTLAPHKIGPSYALL